MMAPPSWAYQAENFVPPADEELICSICRAVFCDPVQCPCGHVFCRTCISKWLQANKNCPVCRKRATRSSLQDVVPLLKNMILKLPMRCRNEGCEETFSLEACEHHAKLCLWELVSCKNQACPERRLRREMSRHERRECLFRCVKCTTCCLDISERLSKKHCCISELKKALKEKESTIEEKNQFIKKQEARIQQLQAEIKSLKDADRELDTSSGDEDSLSAEDVMISVADFPSLSTSDSSLSMSDSTSGLGEWLEIPPPPPSPPDRGEREQHRNHSSNSAPPDFFGHVRVSRGGNLQDSLENPRASSPWNDSFAAFLETPTIEIDDSLPSRRPNKRRHALPNAADSDPEDGRGSRSPKRCWRMNSEEEEVATGATAESTNDRARDYFLGAGPSFRSDSISSESSGASSRLGPRANKRNREASLNSASGGQIFERTVELLERYNLESDPEWTPEMSSHGGNDTTSDSEEEAPPLVPGSDDSSWSSDLSDSSAHTADLISGIFDSSDDDDDEWHPH